MYPTQVEGTEPVFVFWHATNEDYTFHFGDPWVGEIKSTSKTQPQFFAYPNPVEGLNLEPVFLFWHEGDKSHTIHMGNSWPGEEKQGDEVVFYAFPVEQ